MDRKYSPFLSIALSIEFAVFSMIVVAPTPTSRTGDSPTGTSDSSASDSANILPTSSSAATLSYTIQTSLLGLFSLLGFALA